MDARSAASTITAGREALLAGDVDQAISHLEARAVVAPGDYEVRYWLASAYLAAGDWAGANGALEDARIFHAVAIARAHGADLARCRSDAGYAASVAIRLYQNDLVAVAGAIWIMRLSTACDAGGLVHYGLALQHQGRAEEACGVFRAAVETAPSAGLHQFLLYPQILCEDGEARFAEETRRWAELYAPAAQARPLVGPDRLQGAGSDRLRIGYVAPTFAGSQLRQFMAPLLDNHDPSQVSVTLYPARAETGWPAHIAVTPIGGLSDAEAADRIRADGIEVLNDCWGHTAGSRLGVFAARAAPVQVGWINFIQTSGLAQMDFVLHADGELSPEMAAHFTEQVWPIGPVFNAFRPGAGRLDPVPTPALRKGQVTFGSFNHPAKLSDFTLAAWAAVLRQTPRAVLRLKYRYYADPVLQRVTQARFAAQGVAPERLLFEGHSRGEDYFRAFQDIDLFLDSWPAPGMTTTLDALSHGAPVLTMAGSSLGSRHACSILEAAGLPDLIASSPEDFVARAVALASDLDRLNAVRARVRPGFDGGAICDEAGFTRRVETAFREMADVKRARLPAAA